MQQLGKQAYPRFAALARGGDTRPVMVYARTLSLLASTYLDAGQKDKAAAAMKSALEQVDWPMSCAPSAAAWDLRLSTTRARTALQTEVVQRAGGRRRMGRPDSATQLAACWKWLKSLPRWSQGEGQLAVYCCRLEWMSKGSISRVARRDEQWQSMTTAQQKELVREIYKQYTAQLTTIERRTGPLVEIYLSRARNAAQVESELARHTSYKPDLVAAFAPLVRAQQLWPGEHRLLAAEAQLHRHFWRFAEAISMMRRVVLGDPDGERRRRATVDYIECLITAASRNEPVTLPGGEALTAVEMLEEADRYIPHVRGYAQTASIVASYSDRINFEPRPPRRLGIDRSGLRYGRRRRG